jgi:hypothetical protein
MKDNVLGDKTTTIAGLALASAGYVSTVGVQLPQNQGEWVAFALNALVAILGLLAKR